MFNCFPVLFGLQGFSNFLCLAINSAPIVRDFGQASGIKPSSNPLVSFIVLAGLVLLVWLINTVARKVSDSCYKAVGKKSPPSFFDFRPPRD